MTFIKAKKHILFLILSGILLSQAFQNCGGYRATSTEGTSQQSGLIDNEEGSGGSEIPTIPIVPPQPPGTIDQTFGIKGQFQFQMTSPLIIRFSRRDSLGRIYLGSGRMLRFKADMTLDLSFGTQGLLNVVPTGEAFITADLLPNGKLIVFTQDLSFNNNFLRQYLINGSLDSTFGTNGLTTWRTTTYIADSYGFGVLPNGKILTKFTARENVMPAWHTKFFLFNADGKPDTTFVDPPPREDAFGPQWSGYVGAVTPQPDSKIIVAYYLSPSTGLAGVGNEGVGVLRLNANGSLDTTFGNGGLISRAINNGLPNITHARVLKDGKILVGGYAWDVTPNKFNHLFMGLTPNGQVDTSFGNQGVTNPFPGESEMLWLTMISPKGKMISLSQGRYFQIDNRGAKVTTFAQKGFLTPRELGLSDDVGEFATLVHTVIDELLMACISSKDLLKFRCVRFHF